MLNIKYGQSPLLFLNLIIIAYSIGVYMTNQIHLSYTHLFYLIIVNIILSAIATHFKYKTTFIFYLLLFFLVGVFRTISATTIPVNNISNFENQSISVHGIVCQYPKIRQDNEGLYHLTYIIDVLDITKDHTKFASNGKIYVYQKQKTLEKIASANDEITLNGTIKLITAYHNPGLIDTENSAKIQGIYAKINLGEHAFTSWQKNNSFSLQQNCDSIRQLLLNKFLLAMPAQDANLFFAMLFGGYANIDDTLLSAYSTTGIIHILSVSGSHITLLTIFLLFFAKKLHLPNSIMLLCVFSFLTFYAILCGASAPVLRATIMSLLYLVALYRNELATSRHLLSVVALCFLSINPLLLYDISFQLSFLSTAGLFYLMPILRDKLSFFPPIIADSFSLTLSAQIFTLPLLSWYFNLISLSSLFSNLIIVPPLELIIILGLLASLLCFFIPFISHLLLILASLILKLSNFLTLLLAKMPFASIYIPSFHLIDALLYYFFIYLLLKKPTFRISFLQKPIYIMLIFLFCATCIKLATFEYTPSLKIHFIDVGQGDACLIITPHKHSILIDTGGNINSEFDLGSRVLIPYLYHYGITKLDYLIISHSDIDHCGGINSLSQKIPINHLIISDEPLTTYAQKLNLPENTSFLKNALKATEHTQFSLDDVSFTFLQQPSSKLNSSNDHSNVIKLKYHNFSALFTGDISQEVEQSLLSKDLHATLLKVAHHGSKHSSSREFLDAVKPQIAIISVGKYNNFNHPAPQVLQALQEHSRKILRTDKQGAIIISTDGYKFHYQSFIN